MEVPGTVVGPGDEKVKEIQCHCACRALAEWQYGGVDRKWVCDSGRTGLNLCSITYFLGGTGTIIFCHTCSRDMKSYPMELPQEVHEPMQEKQLIECWAQMRIWLSYSNSCSWEEQVLTNFTQCP